MAVLGLLCSGPAREGVLARVDCPDNRGVVPQQSRVQIGAGSPWEQ